MSLDHAPTCRCAICRTISDGTAPITQADRERLAELWETWHSVTDGEVIALRAGRDGAPGSPRWIALKAIAATRLTYAGESR